MLPRLVALLSPFFCVATLFAQQPGDSSSRVRVTSVLASTVAAPGADLPLAVVLEIDPGWHIWTDDRPLPEGASRFDGAIYTEITAPTSASAIRAPSRATGGWIDAGAADEPQSAVFAQWPTPHLVTADLGDGEHRYATFDGSATIFVPLAIAPTAAEGTHTLTLSVTLQACDDSTCLAPATLSVPITMDVRRGAATPTLPREFSGFDGAVYAKLHSGSATSAVVFDAFGAEFSIDPSGAGFILLLAVAALGGLLLNFTPCVLPVIPLKIMGLAATAGNRRRCAQLGAALSAGVVLFWIGLGVAVAALAGFTSSQLFQYPLFTVGVGLVIGVMAVGMCGVFSVQLPQSIAGIDFRHDTILGSVGFGVMTAVLSTPCTAPLMGAAAAWAATQPPVTVLSVFGAIGAGMAMPYLVLSIFPQLVSRVPRSGPASDLVKQTMGLLLLAAAAYFVGSGVSGWLVSPPTPPSHAYWWVVSALGTAAGFWLARGTLRIAKSARARIAFTALGCAIALLSGAIAWRLTDEGPIAWVYYTPERLDAALREGDAVIIDFTAEWCLNCKTLENTVLATEAVVARIDRGDVTPIKVDLTGNNEAGRALLTRFERLTIPLLVVMTRDGRVVFKSDAYTPAQVINALDEATGTGTPAVTTAP
jgi:thiol:disulfide interchange protein DsbD